MSDPLLDLTGKIALVTGGSRGLGRCISQAFAEHGATVVIASRKHDACVAAAHAIADATGRTVRGFGVHVGRWDDCDRLIEAILDEFG